MKTNQIPSLWKFPIHHYQTSDEALLKNFINKNIEEYDYGRQRLASTYRRIQNLSTNYLPKGNILYKIINPLSSQPIACIGLGPMCGLSFSDKIGEIRDFAVDKDFRRLGLGKLLLTEVTRSAKLLGYKRLYLETTEQMIVAQSLFENFGFRAVKEVPKEKHKLSKNPSYYLLEKL